MSTIQTRWGEKPYYSFDTYCKECFGEKIYKIALDAGLTCPNRDGTLDTRGCIFCSAGGSGDFAVSCHTTVSEQIEEGIAFLQSHGKQTGKHFIAYFQSFSNTYAPLSTLRSLYRQALAHPDIVGLAIATRPDCFSEEIYDLLEECARIKPVWVELGLQTIHESTARYIRRGYPLSVFEATISCLYARGIPVVTHVILGLPGETHTMILDTIRYLNDQPIQGIKLQLLHVLRGTDLAKELGTFPVYDQQEYVDLVVDCIAHLSPRIVVHRLTGDGPKDLLLAPLWSTHKRTVLNAIAHQMKTQKIFQGCALLKEHDGGKS